MLSFDPAGPDFAAQLRAIPGYPAGELLPIRAMVFEADALMRLPELLQLSGARPDRPLLVVMDRTAMRRAGAELKPLALELLRAAGWSPQPCWLEADATGQVHTDFAHIRALLAQLEPGCGVLALGSGTVTDIAKHACFLAEHERGMAPLPLVVFQTANSVSAYTSNMAPVFVQGVKRTLASRYPDVLVCDLETLRAAPAEMTAAGVGDLLAAFGSYADWFLAGRLGLDPGYTPFAQTLMGPLDQILLVQAGAIRAATPAGAAVLAKLIALAGLAMSLSHATAPLSGFEHVISHVLDLLAERGNRPLAQHGAQVALATLLSTAAYRIFLERFDPAQLPVERCFPEPEHMRAQIVSAFESIDPSGQVAEECWSDYRQKLEAWRAQRASFAVLLGEWPAVRAELRALTRPPELAAQIMRAVGAPLTFEQLTPPAGEDDVRFAFWNAPLIRKRLTLGDLLIFVQWDRDALWRSVWATSRALGRPAQPS
jgi:glycerol-1-phosphate dehydrogenase [NAD(P)+]